MKKLFEILAGVGIIIATIAVGAVIMALPTMLLWNYLMPQIFGLCRITFLQALALCVLCGILFGQKSGKKS